MFLMEDKTQICWINIENRRIEIILTPKLDEIFKMLNEL